MGINKVMTVYSKHFNRKIPLVELIQLINSNLNDTEKPLTPTALNEIMLREGREIAAIQSINPEHLKYIKLTDLVKQLDDKKFEIDLDFALIIATEFSSNARKFVLNELKYLRSGEQLLELPLTQDLNAIEGSTVANEIAGHFEHTVFLKAFYSVDELNPRVFDLDRSSVEYAKQLAIMNHRLSYDIFAKMHNPLLTKENPRIDLIEYGFLTNGLLESNKPIYILAEGYYPTQRLLDLIDQGYIKLGLMNIKKDRYIFKFETLMLHVSLYSEIRAAFSHHSDLYDSSAIL